MGLIDPERPQEWTAFIAVIQLGTLIAVVLFFIKDALSITRGFVIGSLAYISKGRNDRRAGPDESIQWGFKMGWLVIIGSIPIGICGVLFKDLIEGSLTKSLWVISSSLIAVAIILIIAEKSGRRARDVSQITVFDSVVVGLAQVLALIPGSSRSGTTIAGGLFSGLTREAAARFSFLLSIPAIAASGLFELPSALSSIHTAPLSLFAATGVSAVSGYLSIGFLLRHLRTRSTLLFVVYRIALGLAISGMLVTGRIAP
jgi:undecaprenyl-diphosphatase